MEKNKQMPINPALLWDCDLKKIDWWKSRLLVVQRVVERGRPSDFEGIYKLYGGKEGVREIIKQVRELSPRDMNFVCRYFKLEKRELESYTREQKRREYLEL